LKYLEGQNLRNSTQTTCGFIFQYKTNKIKICNVHINISKSKNRLYRIFEEEIYPIFDSDIKETLRSASEIAPC
jgi:hypothetical protein